MAKKYVIVIIIIIFGMGGWLFNNILLCSELLNCMASTLNQMCKFSSKTVIKICMV